MEEQDDFLSAESEIQELFEEIDHIISFSERRDEEVLRRFGRGAEIEPGMNSNFKAVEIISEFDEAYIKSLCIRYRLRFLPVSLYTGKVPYEVISKIKLHEHKYHNIASELFILAPASFFLLKNQYDDPLLFAVTEQGNYMLLCQWGKRLPWFIPIVRYPYRDFKSMVLSSLFVGLIVATIAGVCGVMPADNLFKSILIKVPIMIVSAGSFSTLALCYGLISKTDFSADNWKSRYFKKPTT